MDINRANIEIFFTDLKLSFEKAFEEAAPTFKQWSMSIPSTTSTEDYGWLKQIPGMREWIGDRQINNIESKDMSVKNKLYENTLEIPRVDIEDDKVGIYRQIVPGMGIQAANYPEELLVGKLCAGATDTWADDVAFFSAAGRTFGGNTICNYTTTTLGATGFNTAYTYLTSFLGDNNRPIRVQPIALLHGPAKRTKAFEVCRDDFYARTADASTIVQGRNPNAGKVIPIETPYLVDGITLNGTAYTNAGTYWFLLGEIVGMRAAVWQERKAVETQTAKATNDSEFVMEEDKYQFGARGRGAAFLSMPHLVIGNLATT